MKFVLLALSLSVAVVFVFSSRCEHGDVNQCSGVNCTDSNMVVGCEHDVCTCVNAPQSCLSKGDCINVQCKHDEDLHCKDAVCVCMKIH